MMEELSQRIAGLSPVKLELFTRRVSDKGPSAAKTRAVAGRREPGSAAPLSFAQERLWFVDQIEPGNPAYNIPAAVRIEGRLSIASIEQAINEIARRHEILRTAFKVDRGRGAQIIPPALQVVLPVVNLGAISEADRDELSLRLAREEALRSFDLSRAPLFRAILLKLGEEDHVALLTMHHIVSDAWSVQLFIREVAVLCAAFSDGAPSPLDDLQVQYADFAEWERESLQGDVLEAEMAYWKRQLADTAGVLNLPTDRPRPAVQTFHGARQSLELSPELSREVKELGQREGATVFMTLLAGFKALLHRYTGQDDISVGTPISGRNLPETETLIGCFVNTVVLRADFSGNPSFRKFLGQVRETALGAYSHAGLPFDMLVAELQPARDLGCHPLFQVFFRIDTPLRPIKLESLSLDRLDVKNETAKFDMEWSIAETPQGFVVSVNYNTDLFDQATIAKMLEHYEALLSDVTASPDRLVLDIELEPPGEQGPFESPDFNNLDHFSFEM